MREKICINDNWIFSKEGFSCKVNLPHTWNAYDGQGDEGNSYSRCKCTYSRDIAPIDAERVIIEFEGANSLCTVRVNGTLLGTHKGGYSHFRYDITGFAKQGCTITAEVDNSNFEEIYPSVADFTFFGGLYRNVNLILTGNCRFSSKDYGSDGLYVTPFKSGDEWFLGIKSLIEGKVEGAKIKYDLLDAEGNVYRSAESDISKETTYINCGTPNLWNGRKGPYLYTLNAEIILPDGTVSDNLSIKTGFRTFEIDSQKGAFLNGEHIKIRGLCRHQDREDMGNAITIKEHKEDMDIILETGANALRLAHYQQAEEFYSLCDENGILVWAEVPVISKFSQIKHPNAKRQLTELIKQNYNHPSIFAWGIENEITMSGITNVTMYNCLDELDTIVKTLDSTRYSTCAQFTMLPPDSPLNEITDILGYNHYFGWYMGKCEDLGPWLDRFAAVNPDAKLCISEYGADAVLNWQTDKPEQGDYTEEYQCVFHEKYLKEINSRENIWGSFLWNTFDFAACKRDEGGVIGRNNKGLVTYDRHTKKDAFYFYKASWSEEDTLHICGQRYVKRPIGTTDIKVYSNKAKVSLTSQGKTYTLEGETIFEFKDIPIAEGENIITAKAGKLSETIKIIGVAEPYKYYKMPSELRTYVRNWNVKENCLTLEDSIGDILESEDTKEIVHNKFGEKFDFVFKAAKPLKKVKIGSAVGLAKKVGIPEEYANMAEGYLKTFRKK